MILRARLNLPLITLLGLASFSNAQLFSSSHGDIDLLIGSFGQGSSAELFQRHAGLDVLNQYFDLEDRKAIAEDGSAYDTVKLVRRKTKEEKKPSAPAPAPSKSQNQKQPEPKKPDPKKPAQANSNPPAKSNTPATSDKQAKKEAESKRKADNKAKADLQKKIQKEEKAKQKAEANAAKQKKKEEAKVEKEKKNEAKKKAKQDKKNADDDKRAKQNHELELKANKKSADKHIDGVRKIGNGLEKDVKKQKDRNEKSIKKEKNNLDKATKQLEDAKKPGAGGKKHDKNLKKAEENLAKAKGKLEGTEKKSKDSLDKINNKADRKIVKEKTNMFNDWKKNNKDQWKIVEGQIAEAKKHPSKAKRIGMKILEAFQWIGTAALSIIPGLGPVMGSALAVAKTAATIGIKEGVKQGIKTGIKKGAEAAAKKIESNRATKAADKAGDTQRTGGTSTYTMNSAEDDKNKHGIETNAMKTEIQNQRNGLEIQFDVAANDAKRKGAMMKRALQDMDVWDDYLGVVLWRRAMLMGRDKSRNSIEGAVLRRVVDVSTRNEIRRRMYDDIWNF